MAAGTRGDGGSLAHRLGRAGVGALPPPARRRVRAWRHRSSVRAVPLDRLDDELEEAARLFGRSEDAARRFLAGFEVRPPADQPRDPFSDEYREWTWHLYRQISGRTGYSVTNEGSPFDLAAAVRRPFPYATGSAVVVGDDLAARGHLIRTLDLAVPARIVEFGPGWGNLTIDLATMGHQVTAVEVEPQFCSLIERRCPVPANLTTVCQDMLAFRTGQPFDAAVFFESFHHCADHAAMLRQLLDVVAPDGVVALATEPIDDLAYPWGPRLDGLSLWSARTYGWLELGFDPGYFAEAVARAGWRATRHRAAGAPSADAILLRRGERTAGSR